MIHFGLIFVKTVRFISGFLKICMWVSSYASTLCWKSLFPMIAFVPLSKFSWLFERGLFLGFLFCPICLLICLILRRYHTDLIWRVQVLQLPSSSPSLCELCWVICLSIQTLESVCWYSQNNLLRIGLLFPRRILFLFFKIEIFLYLFLFEGLFFLCDHQNCC